MSNFSAIAIAASCNALRMTKRVAVQIAPPSLLFTVLIHANHALSGTPAKGVCTESSRERRALESAVWDSRPCPRFRSLSQTSLPGYGPSCIA